MKIHDAIYSEDYCCLKGFLGLCAARNQSAKSMAEGINMSPDIVWYYKRRDAKGLIPCEGKPSCMKPLIEEIKKGG